MDQDHLRTLLEQVRAGAVEVDAAMERLKHLPFEDLGFAKVDHHRRFVTGCRKWSSDLARRRITWWPSPAVLTHAPNVLVTRTTAEVADRLKDQHDQIEYFPSSGAVRVWRDRTITGKGTIAVVSAGTSDLPVAEEARVTAEVMGNEVSQILDIGVAGIHRVMQNRERLSEARVVIVCAGMEGALPSVIGGLVAAPVIAVPTSIGYGASFHGLAALLGMLNSCASNVTVVNIDNGFGAGYAASLMNRL